jgi:hypothetical protein
VFDDRDVLATCALSRHSQDAEEGMESVSRDVSISGIFSIFYV